MRATVRAVCGAVKVKHQLYVAVQPRLKCSFLCMFSFFFFFLFFTCFRSVALAVLVANSAAQQNAAKTPVSF